MESQGDDQQAVAYAPLFRTLRAQLSAQVAAHASAASSSSSSSNQCDSDQLNARPATSSASLRHSTRSAFSAPESELLGLVAQRTPELRAALQLEALERTRHRVRELLRRRLDARERRDARAQALAQQQRAVRDDCVSAIGAAELQATRYAELTRQSLSSANQRLQTLLFECVAEMRTAVGRLEAAAAIDAPDGVERAVTLARERTRQLEWDVFLARLGHDLSGAVRFAQLFPTVHSASTAGDDEFEAKLRAVLVRNGPVLPPASSLQLRRVVAVTSTGTAPTPESARAKPSLLFGDSGPDVWTDIARASLRLAAPAAAAAGSSSRRRPGRRVAQSSGSLPTFATAASGSKSSEIRQLPAASTPQFPRTECGVLLSSACVRWLLKDVHAAASASRWVDTADASVYFDPEELGRGPDDAPDDDVLLAARSPHQRKTRFARASVLQLLQTAYYAKRFLSQLSASDAAHIERLYPSTLVGAKLLSTLYVPCVDADSDANADSEPEVVVARLAAREIVMRALDDAALHELLLLFVARGRRESGASGRQVASLAVADAISELYPRHPDERDEGDASERGSAAVYQCAIRNPGGLWKQPSRTAGHDAALSSADHLYVEMHATSAAPDAVALIHAALESGCSWRACLAPAETVATRPRDSRERGLCAWHAVLEQQLAGADEAEQHLSRASASPNSVASALARGSRAEALRRVVVKNSSLLDELASRQLRASIASFVNHVKLSLSNRAFKASSGAGGDDRGSPADPTALEPPSQSGIEALETLAESWSQVLALERSCTKEFARFAQLTACSGVDASAVRSACVEVQELDADVRTDDVELLARLGTRKLQLLRRRREEAEARASQRLAPSSATLLPPSRLSSRGAGAACVQDPTTSVYDVIHVLRKGSKSLRDRHELARPQTGGTKRLGATDTPGLSRSVSEILDHARALDSQCQAVRRLEVRRAAHGGSGRTQRK